MLPTVPPLPPLHCSLQRRQRSGGKGRRRGRSIRSAEDKEGEEGERERKEEREVWWRMREGHRKERDDLQAKGGGGGARFDLREREDERGREREREKEGGERREKERGERRGGGRRRSGEDHRKECRRLIVFHTYPCSCRLQGCCKELEVVRWPEQQEQGYGRLSSLPRFPPLPSALEMSTCRLRQTIV
ncbi:unnamed protein product [Triticum turgidum subsp. durum]|uniref:Uncharacterized protein n=1 Tax=Triticum turgidum subsp. durum TaxID=4567 RepID=A0A9R0V332_TRITD|nr:unnamed protein product [Triticum turgidum subsp. durum]